MGGSSWKTGARSLTTTFKRNLHCTWSCDCVVGPAEVHHHMNPGALGNGSHLIFLRILVRYKVNSVLLLHSRQLRCLVMHARPCIASLAHVSCCMAKLAT